MKFQITMKTPDALDIINREVASMFHDIDADEAADLREQEAEKALAVCRKWFKHDEYLVVEVDTDFGTIRIMEA